MQDPRGRMISYLRLSVTELCNLRCRYCMPPEGIIKRRHEEMLTEEEMLLAVRAAASLGVFKVRVTGGEPLVKKNILSICRGIRETEGIRELCLTTNGILLPQMAGELRRAGVDRINLSLDTLDKDRYREITRGGDLEEALRGLDAALENGFDRVKINAVLLPDTEPDEIRLIAGLTERLPVDVRFIELMPMPGNGVEKGEDFVPAARVLDALPSAVPVSEEEMKSWDKGTVARLYHLPGAQGNIGLISPLSMHFCSSCNRLRLTADGHIRPCLHDAREYSIKGCSYEEMREQFIYSIQNKPAENPTLKSAEGQGKEKTDREGPEQEKAGKKTDIKTGGEKKLSGRSMNRIGG